MYVPSCVPTRRQASPAAAPTAAVPGLPSLPGAYPDDAPRLWHGGARVEFQTLLHGGVQTMCCPQSPLQTWGLTDSKMGMLVVFWVFEPFVARGNWWVACMWRPPPPPPQLCRCFLPVEGHLPVTD
jgi:hypothetical protein